MPVVAVAREPPGQPQLRQAPAMAEQGDYFLTSLHMEHLDTLVVVAVDQDSAQTEASDQVDQAAAVRAVKGTVQVQRELPIQAVAVVAGLVKTLETKQGRLMVVLGLLAFTTMLSLSSKI